MDNSIIKTHHIFINSSMRTVGTTNDFVITLKNPLTLTNQRNHFQVMVGESMIPHTIQQVNASNSTVGYSFVKGATNYNGTITLGSGNYNINTLLTELSSKLSSNILAMTTKIVNLSFSYNKTVAGVILSVIGNDGIITTITIKFSTNLTLGGFFGFTQNAVFSYSSLNVSSNALSDISVNVNPINYVYIRSSSLTQRESYENIVEKDVYSDILAKVAVNVAPGSYIFTNGSDFVVDLDNKIIDQIALYLSDNLSYTLNLNGLPWSTHLIFTEIGTNISDNLLMNSSEQVVNAPVNPVDNELLAQIDSLKQEIANSKEEGGRGG